MADDQTRLFANEAAELARTLRAWGATPPGRDEPRPQRTLERWCVAKWLEFRLDIAFPICVLHREAPDFEIVEGGRRYFLEVTTAAIENEQREATREARDGVSCKRYSFSGDEIDVAANNYGEAYTRAIEAKVGKYCERPVCLLVYDNLLNPCIFEADRKRVGGQAVREFHNAEFSSVTILAPGGGMIHYESPHGR